MRTLRAGALGYVIVVLVAVLNEMSGGFVVSPAEAAFVPFAEGAPIINNYAEEQVFGTFHRRDNVGPVFTYVQGPFHAFGKRFAQFIPPFSRFHDWGSQEVVGIVNSRGTLWEAIY